MKSKDEKLSSAQKDLKLFKSLISGSNPVEAPSSTESETWSPSKDEMIKTFAKNNNVSEFTATLQLGRTNPELFNN